MVSRPIFSILLSKKLSIWTFLIVLLLATIIFLYYLKPSINLQKFIEQYKNSAKIRHNIVNNIQDPVYLEENFINNSKDCPYYGPQHGLFHPTVEHPRFIITGGAGFIGSHLVKRLRQQYKTRQIKILDNLWRGHLYNLQFENGTWAISIALDFCLVDLRNTNDANKFITGADVIFHLAGTVAGINYISSHQSSIFRNNLFINSNTIHAAKTNKVQNFIYAGTACSFSKFLHDSMESESSHDWSKLIGEYEAELARSDTFKVGIIRLSNVYGPYSDYSATTGQVIPSLIRKALNYKNESFIVWGSGKQYRDFVYVEDVIDSLISMLKRGMNKDVIQIGSAKMTTIKELAQIVSQLVEVKLQKKINLTFDNTQSQGDSGHIANLDRAKSILKWQPKTDIKEGISATISWITKNREKQRVLVIVIGQACGGELAW
jgi:nucleoside-diphosphate-sugar epimerase